MRSASHFSRITLTTYCVSVECVALERTQEEQFGVQLGANGGLGCRGRDGWREVDKWMFSYLGGRHGSVC